MTRSVRVIVLDESFVQAADRLVAEVKYWGSKELRDHAVMLRAAHMMAAAGKPPREYWAVREATHADR